MDNRVGAYQPGPAPTYYQQENQMKRLSDAQLLLDFAAYAFKNTESPARKRASVSHLQTTSGNQTVVPPPNSLHTSVHYPNARTADSSLPPEMGYNVHNTESTHIPPTLSSTSRPPVQIHTPPEEVLGAPIAVNAGVSNEPDEKKSKRGQGWPKGKPRGPRSGAAADKKKKPVLKQGSIPTNVTSEKPAADQLQSPQSLSADGPEAPSKDEQDTSALIIPSEPTPATLQGRRLSYSAVQDPETNLSVTQTTSPRARSVPPSTAMTITPFSEEAAPVGVDSSQEAPQLTICAGCNSTDSLTSIGDGEQWISCDGCKEWFHYSCVGFKSEREVRAIDKFYCNGCKPRFGNTTSKSAPWMRSTLHLVLTLHRTEEVQSCSHGRGLCWS